MVLFLDFDGVLHPDGVYMTPQGPQLRSSGCLFMWAPILEKELAPFPKVKIVLSTSWVRQLDFSRAKKRLPIGLQTRVIGSTWHSSMSKIWADQVWWDQTSRHGQILRYVARANISDWFAIDDDAEGWACTNRDRLLLTDPNEGLITAGLLEELRIKLK
ncbi:HAD domain-containing protein [Pseudomonas alliivorans]|uniref:HAD domain-containing protein n=1 Tax=Pseudomonas fragariae (ex Marin et al. 2024) TaxID=3080056 RepID=UPI002ED436F0|nr:HAD domain-containing protein [Pseudomonas alliivorans]MEE5072210.1 HAD domain-containing protein [Pseudomonas alliivorans]